MVEVGDHECTGGGFISGECPIGDSRIAEIGVWLKEQYDRAEILLRVARASQAAELRRVTFLQRYLKVPDRPLTRVVGSY